MAPLVLRKANGDEIPLLSLTPLVGVSKAEQKQELLNVDTLSFSVSSNAPINFGIGDTIASFGQLYTLNQVPAYKRNGQARFEYDVTLEGPQYHLLRVIYFDTDQLGNALSSTFSLTGNLSMFVQVLFTNLARVFSGAWGLGFVFGGSKSDLDGNPTGPVAGILTETKTLTFDNENCLQVLQRLCQEYNTEFRIDYDPYNAPNRILNVTPIGTVQTDRFAYGEGRGLYEFSRRSVQQTPFFTRLYVFGSQKNLPSGYRGFATRLQLPLSPSAPPGSYSPWDSYVEDAGAKASYGLIEGTKIFEEVFPHRTGTVQASTSRLTFSDATIPFNPLYISGYDIVNAVKRPKYQYVIPGLTPKVHFQSGQLAGYSFDIVGFDGPTRTFTINSFTDERGVVFPGVDDTSPFRIAAGDTYTLIDLRMPDEYVEAAEAQLLAAGKQFLKENGSPALEYSVILDELYLQKQANDFGAVPIPNPPNFFAVGDQIRLIDEELNIDRYIRIIGFTRDVLKPYKYTLTLGDAPKVPLLARILSSQKDVTRVLGANNMFDPTVNPAQTVPAGETIKKSDVIGKILEYTKVQAAAIKHTLGVAPLPAGYTPLLDNQLVRHKLEVDVYKPTQFGVDQLIAKLQATGVKKLQ